MKKPRLSRAALLVVLLAVSLPGYTATSSGATLRLAEHHGKVVVVDFWASWCVPCRRSFPWLNSMHARYAQDGLVIIGVNVDTDREQAAAFLSEYPARFHISYDPEGRLAREFGVQGMPSSFVIGRDGQIAARHLGFKVKRQDEYEAAIAAALQRETVK